MALIQTKRRAKLCPELEKYLPEIIFRYCAENRKLEEVMAEINGAYGLQATKAQYIGLLSREGIRKRLKGSEWQLISQRIQDRTAAGKFCSGVSLVITGTQLSNETIKRGVKRNTTFTQDLFNKVRKHCKVTSTEASAEPRNAITDGSLGTNDLILSTIANVHTPDDSCLMIIPNPQTTSLITRSALLRLPIWRASDSLAEAIRHLYMPYSDLAAARAHPSTALLRVIIYRLSNDLFKPEEVMSLLDRVDEGGTSYKNAFKSVLKHQNISIKAACQNLIEYLYLRGDEDIITHLREYHPQIKVDLYQRLYQCALGSENSGSRIFGYKVLKDWVSKGFVFAYPSFWRPNIRRSPLCPLHETHYARGCHFVIQEISRTAQRPASPTQARLLLFACKAILNDLTIFFELWDRSEITCHELETQLRASLDLGPRPVWYGAYSGGADRDVRAIPIYSDNPQHIQQLYDAGFREGTKIMLLKSVVENDSAIFEGIAKIFYPEIWSILVASETMATCRSNPHILTQLPAGTLYTLLKETLEDIEKIFPEPGPRPEIQKDGIDPFCHLAFYVGSQSKDIMEEVLKILETRGSENSVGQKLSNLVYTIKTTSGTDAIGVWYPVPFVARSLRCSILNNITHIAKQVLVDKSVVMPALQSLWAEIWAGIPSTFWLHSERCCATTLVVLEFFEAMGINPDAEFEPNQDIYWSSALQNGCYVFLQGRAAGGKVVALQVAFHLKYPHSYVGLLARGATHRFNANTDTYDTISPVDVRGFERWRVNSDFTEAALQRNLDSIEKLWDTRVEEIYLIPSDDMFEDILDATNAGNIGEAVDLFLSIQADGAAPISLQYSSYREDSGEKNERKVSLVEFMREFRFEGRNSPFFIHGSEVVSRLFDLIKIEDENVETQSNFLTLPKDTARGEWGFLHYIAWRFIDDDNDLLLASILNLCRKNDAFFFLTQQGPEFEWLRDEIKLKCIKVILAAGFDANTAIPMLSENRTLLFSACQDGCLDTTAHLLSHGANVFIERNGGRRWNFRTLRPIQDGVINGRIDVVSLILEFYPECWGDAMAATDMTPRWNQEPNTHSAIMKRFLQEWWAERENITQSKDNYGTLTSALSSSRQIA